jgi:WD40 repeat protein
MQYLLRILSSCLLLAMFSPVVVQAQEPKLELVLQTGHTSSIESVALSADGKLALTGSRDNTAILWDCISGQQLRSFKAHIDWVRCVALSADGKRALIGSEDGTVTLWDSVTGNKLHTFAGHANRVRSVALSADGKRALTGSDDGTAILWDSVSGKKLHTLAASETNYPPPIMHVALSANGKRAITAVGDGKGTILWDSITGKKLHNFDGSFWPGALSADGKLLFGSKGDTAILWDHERGEKLHTLKGHAAPVMSVAFSPGSKLALTGSWDDTAILWDSESGKKLRTFKAYSGSVALSSDGKHALIVSGYGAATLWDSASGKSLHTFKGYAAQVSSVALSSDATTVFTGSHDNTAIIWDSSRSKPLHVLTGHTDWVNSVALSAAGRRGLTGSLDKTVIVWDITSGKKLYTFTGHSDIVHSVALSADGNQALTTSGHKTAILWNSSSGKELHTFKGNTSTLSADGKRALIGSGLVGADNATAILWDCVSGKDLHSLQLQTSGITSVALSIDGKFALTGSAYDKTAILWDCISGKELHTFAGRMSWLSSVALSANGKYALTGFEDNTAILWDSLTGKRIYILKGHAARVNSVALSADGKVAATGSADGTTRLWDTATGKEHCSLISIDAGKDWLVTTPDGYFDTSENAAKLISYRITGTLEFVPLERYRKQFERPGLLAMIMKGEDYRRKDIKQDLPPIVRIVSPTTGRELKDGMLTIEAEAQTRGEYSITSFRLHLNGHPYPKKLGVFQLAEPQTGKSVARWDIELEPGKYNIQVHAHTKAVFGVSEVVDIRYVGGNADVNLPLPNLYVLAIGISKYQRKEDQSGVTYCARDADAVANAYRTNSKALFKEIEVRILTDDQATRDGIMDGLAWLSRRMTQKDFCVVYYAGHGMKDERDHFYFLPVNYQKNALGRTAIHGDEFVRELPSVGQRTIILDACHSGAIGRNPFRGLTDEIYRDLTSEEKGFAMMCSASGRELARESNEHRHGRFTVALLEGLAGQSNGKTGKDEIKMQLVDGAVYFKQLDTYMTYRMRELSGGEQHPVTFVPKAFRDFPVSRP